MSTGRASQGGTARRSDIIDRARDRGVAGALRLLHAGHDRKAADLLQSAAAAGHGGAQAALGYCHAVGRGVPRSRSKAIRWLRLAAAQREGDAAEHLGCLYRDGGPPRLAASWFRRAVELGRLDAQTSLGHCYDVGTGVRPSRQKALYWYRKAAVRGNCSAANNIGTVYRDAGRPRIALRWFQKAVALGDAHSLLNIAKLFLGPLRDPEQARRALARLARYRRVTEDTQEQAAALRRSLGSSSAAPGGPPRRTARRRRGAQKRRVPTRSAPVG